MMKGTFSRGKKLYPAHYALLYYTKGEPRVFNRVRLPIPLEHEATSLILVAAVLLDVTVTPAGPGFPN